MIKDSLEKIFGKASLKEWIIAFIEAPFYMLGLYIIYCLMYIIIGG